MSLYSFEEICIDCIKARWHGCELCHNGRGDGQVSFCSCLESNESMVNGYDGTCPCKELAADAAGATE